MTQECPFCSGTGAEIPGSLRTEKCEECDGTGRIEMNRQTIDDVKTDATERLEDMFPNNLERALEAKKKIEESLTEMTASGRVLELTDEEERMIRCFRQFKARNSKPGVVFKWQTHPDAGIVKPPEEVLIVDPQDRNS